MTAGARQVMASARAAVGCTAMFATDDTIVAVATPPGRGGLGVVRISGSRAAAVASEVLERKRALEPRQVTLTRVLSLSSPTASVVDQVLVTWFPAPHSYTGEEVIEISGHGSPVVMRQLVELLANAGARPAHPGEFTLRAFLRGKIDLTQAEAIGDLVDALTPGQARAALKQLEGSVSQQVSSVSRELFELTARLEASLDFPDEGYHFADPDGVALAVARLVDRLRGLVACGQRGQVLREGRRVAILGRPNVGKSSVFNRLLDSPRAIVSSAPGTTRDLLVETLDLCGVPVTLIDTAGLRESAEEVEVEGIRRARLAGRGADLSLLILDGSSEITAADLPQLDLVPPPRLVVINKSDLPGAWDAPGLPQLAHDEPLRISARTGEGFVQLQARLLDRLGADALVRETPAVSNVRHVELFKRAVTALDRGQQAAERRAPEELVLSDLHLARSTLEEITGERSTEAMLRHIFANFCIGK